MEDVDAVVFDVLGTLVDEPGGIRRAIREAVPDAGDDRVAELLATWQRHIEGEQHRIVAGKRGYASSAALDREAAERVAGDANIADGALVDRLAQASRSLTPWADSVDALVRIASRKPVIGLSNADRSTLLWLSADAGLQWHQVLSADEAGTYKPAAEVYRMAVDVVARLPERVLMVAAHAWDLRAARAVGMRTAYVARPVGDPPAETDVLDGEFGGLHELAAALGT
ncbi:MULTISPECIES: haloacid dehalogenase type II [Prauserella salsuginis group]|uniref:Haloacid dehalogenase type II n=1 Tax=Prauserella salsuginis TaxID=387889 RepID=A0ABW6G2C9_9PSEU|nr:MULTISPECIES: haloacid dehalogenase type II [Prauserella salsuginis group]MCR3719857.1 2-haloacid dehalogenase [Prauserella flava]MCR3736600.1 2-haloacid dehalogenase [Prauserella salsuginis]